MTRLRVLSCHSREGGNPGTQTSMKLPAVYILASKKNGTLYTGVTSDLVQRTWQHREHLAEGFTKRYGVTLLVWYEVCESIEAVILREKQIKKWNRQWKVNMIERSNPRWRDLFDDVVGLGSRLRGNDTP